jgi:DNA-directed RNA polymerase specialized sigma24 family protein
MAVQLRIGYTPRSARARRLRHVASPDPCPHGDRRMSAPSLLPPDDPEALARCVGNPQAPHEQRQDALRRLRPFLAQAARRTLHRHGQASSALQDDVVAHLEWQLWEGRHDPAGGTFAAWCHTVLEHAVLDRLRALDRGPQPLHDAPDGRPCRLRVLEEELDLDAPFAADDRDRIRQWGNPRQRLVVLCRARLWRKLPGEEWAGYLRACGVEPPFPPPDFAELPEGEQLALLAQALEVPANTVSKLWQRGQEALRRLAFLRGLLP